VTQEARDREAINELKEGIANAPFSDAELARIDEVDNSIGELVARLVPPTGKKIFEWDMELIGEIGDLISDYFVEHGICSAQEFKPFVEE
jgi:hypothetical protein